MDSESFIQSPVGRRACRSLLLLLAVSAVLFPYDLNSHDTVPYLKGPRPYLSNLTEPVSIPPARIPEKIPPAEIPFHALILTVSGRYSMDPALVKAVIKAESGYDPDAVSKKGAVGLMQLMPATARSLGVVDLFDPEHNISGGVQYLKKLLKQFKGDPKLAVAAYNAGSRKVKEYNGIPPFRTTRVYVKKVFDYYQHYKAQIGRERDRI